ncbi:TPA: hypothetical protein ACH3X1_008034 [Trebouxia sp. C0004]
MDGAGGSRPRAAALRDALSASSPSSGDMRKKQNRYGPGSECVLATSEFVSCMSTASAMSTDAHTMIIRADADSPSSKGSWLASAPARLQVPLESDSESWYDLRDELSASSDDSSVELMTEPDCSFQIPVGSEDSSEVAKPGSPPDDSHQLDTSARRPDAALELEQIRPDPMGIQCLSVCEVDQSSESTDQLTAQHIRDRYPHLFQTSPPLAAAGSLTVRLQPGTAADPTADSSMADLSPLVMRPAAEASMAADSSQDESLAAEIPVIAEALTAAGGSHMTAVSEAMQILPAAALTGSSGCQRYLPESRDVARAGRSQNALQKGLLGGGHHDSALRQLLQDTNKELAVRLESGYAGGDAKILFSDRPCATLPEPVGQLSHRTLTDSRDGFRVGLGVVPAEHTPATCTGSRPKAAGFHVTPQAGSTLAGDGCATAEDDSAIAEGVCAIAEGAAQSGHPKAGSDQAQLGLAAPRDTAAYQRAAIVGGHAMPEHGAPTSAVNDRPPAKDTTAGDDLAAAQTHPTSADMPHTGFLSVQRRVSTAEDDDDTPAQALNSALQQLATSEIAVAADIIRAAATAQVDAAASQPAAATASGSLAMTQLNCTTAQCEANTAVVADTSPAYLDAALAGGDSTTSQPPATADGKFPAAASTPSLHATDAAEKDDGRLAVPEARSPVSAIVALDLSMTDLQFQDGSAPEPQGD